MSVYDPLRELLVDGEAEVAAGRGYWPQSPLKRQPTLRFYREQLLLIWNGKHASARQLREIARKALNRGQSRTIAAEDGTEGFSA